MIKFNVNILDTKVDFGVNTDSNVISGDVGYINERYKEGIDIPWYDGEYELTPRKIEQQLNTKNTAMKENVKIKPITCSVVANSSGGSTATIGVE